MPAQSQAQQRLFGMAHAVQTGEMPKSDASPEVQQLAATAKPADVTDMAATPHDNLPARKTSEIVEEAAAKYESCVAKMRLENYGEVLREMDEAVTTIETQLMEVADDWFDRNTIARNVKEMRNHVKSVSKILSEIRKMQERAVAHMEDGAHLIRRYIAYTPTKNESAKVALLKKVSKLDEAVIVNNKPLTPAGARIALKVMETIDPEQRDEMVKKPIHEIVKTAKTLLK